MILPELLFSVMYVFGAKYLSISKGNIFKLLLIEGIMGMILSILLQIIAYFFIPCKSIQESRFFIGKVPFCDNDPEHRIKTMIKIFDFEEFGVRNLINYCSIYRVMGNMAINF